MWQSLILLGVLFPLCSSEIVSKQCSGTIQIPSHLLSNPEAATQYVRSRLEQSAGFGNVQVDLLVSSVGKQAMGSMGMGSADMENMDMNMDGMDGMGMEGRGHGNMGMEAPPDMGMGMEAPDMSMGMDMSATSPSTHINTMHNGMESSEDSSIDSVPTGHTPTAHDQTRHEFPEPSSHDMNMDMEAPEPGMDMDMDMEAPEPPAHGMGMDMDMNMDMEAPEPIHGMGMDMDMNMDTPGSQTPHDIPLQTVSFSAVAGMDSNVPELIFSSITSEVSCAEDFECSSIWTNSLNPICAPVDSPQSFCADAHKWLICLRQSSPPQFVLESSCTWPLSTATETLAFLTEFCVLESECSFDECGLCGGFAQDDSECEESPSPTPEVSSDASDPKSVPDKRIFLVGSVGFSVATALTMAGFLVFSKVRSRSRHIVMCQPIHRDDLSITTVHPI